ncbi:hypothetical protein [Aminobacterium colombiense]|uniref:hypothetical protein n=1 Tax=Aminobacterium colombiense TaxID=81468 RepID=UPI0033226661
MTKKEGYKCWNTHSPKKEKPVFVSYKGEVRTIGQIYNNTFFRKCKNSQLLWKYGGSLGVDESVISQLRAQNVKFLCVEVTDQKKKYHISLEDFLLQAKTQPFYGVTRYHVPFSRWEEAGGAQRDKETKGEPRYEQGLLFNDGFWNRQEYELGQA